MSVQNRCCVIKYDLMERSGSFALLASTQRLASTLAPGTARLAEANTSARSFANKAKGDGYQGSSKSKEELQTDESRQYSGSNAQIDKKDVDSYPDKLKSSHKVSSNEESNTDTESSSDGKSRSAKSKEKEASLPTYS
uniref:AlNc14C546G12120 protein n=1 Tax=Albugo laibachii Nc14 TaxID=890382 RepID=F0X130_9STRA|nr:AlNc14C546G12120 [Albugo laibachii Nc14]|eukprot:CCA27482.1 AlNc14C546G12120 [Albugo laibachii Nc14]